MIWYSCWNVYQLIDRWGLVFLNGSLCLQVIETQIQVCGQVPSQLLIEPHPPRSSAMHLVRTPAQPSRNVAQLWVKCSSGRKSVAMMFLFCTRTIHVNPEPWSQPPPVLVLSCPQCVDLLWPCTPTNVPLPCPHPPSPSPRSPPLCLSHQCFLPQSPLMFKDQMQQDVIMVLKFPSNSPVTHVAANTLPHLSIPAAVTVTCSRLFAVNRWHNTVGEWKQFKRTLLIYRI